MSIKGGVNQFPQPIRATIAGCLKSAGPAGMHWLAHKNALSLKAVDRQAAYRPKRERTHDNEVDAVMLAGPAAAGRQLWLSFGWPKR
jgi:hypothetical protein